MSNKQIDDVKPSEDGDDLFEVWKDVSNGQTNMSAEGTSFRADRIENKWIREKQNITKTTEWSDDKDRRK